MAPWIPVQLFEPPKTATNFFRDMLWILKVVASGPVKTMSHHRLLLLEQKFNLHVMLNADHEFLAQKTAPHRDFYNIRKVSTQNRYSYMLGGFVRVSEFPSTTLVLGGK
jgi:AMP deaminase